VRGVYASGDDPPMSRVLIVADAFPPAIGMGVQRTLGFVRYLCDYGWQPVVLTARDKSRIGWDPELCSRVPPDTSVIRTYWFNPRLVGKRLYLLLKGHRSKEEIIFEPLPSNGTTNSLRRWMRAWLLVPDEAIGWLPFAVRSALRAIKTHRVKAIYSTSPSPVAHLTDLSRTGASRTIKGSRATSDCCPSAGERGVSSARCLNTWPLAGRF
jgi:hypothetical protein